MNTNAAKVRPLQAGTREIGLGEVSTKQRRHVEICAFQICAAESSPREFNFIKTPMAQIDAGGFYEPQICALAIGEAQNIVLMRFYRRNKVSFGISRTLCFCTAHEAIFG